MTQDPLKYLRTQVATAEASLSRARANMRSEAERLKISTSGLFGDSAFVSRTTAERWVADAKHNAIAETTKTFQRLMSAAASSSSSTQAADSPKTLAKKIIAAGKKARGEV